MKENPDFLSELKSISETIPKGLNGLSGLWSYSSLTYWREGKSGWSFYS
jgi:hypothetical protein